MPSCHFLIPEKRSNSDSCISQSLALFLLSPSPRLTDIELGDAPKNDGNTNEFFTMPRASSNSFSFLSFAPPRCQPGHSRSILRTHSPWMSSRSQNDLMKTLSSDSI